MIFLGCPRSGTKYITKVCESVGKKVGHERCAKNGISYWKLVAGTEHAHAGLMSFAGHRVLHQVRDPIATIGSMQTLGGNAWSFMRKHLDLPKIKGESKIVVGAKAWVGWNKRAQEIAQHTYRVESLTDPDVWTKFCKWTGIDIGVRAIYSVPFDVNTRLGHVKYASITGRTLRDLNEEVWREVKDLAASYGYRVKS